MCKSVPDDRFNLNKTIINVNAETLLFLLKFDISLNLSAYLCD